MNLLFAEDGRLRSGWRFVISVIFFLLAHLISTSIAAATAGNRDWLFELIYRTALALSLLAGYCLLLFALDRIDGNPLPALGLGKRNWFRQSAHGIAIGFAMITVAWTFILVAALVSSRVILDYSVTLTKKTAIQAVGVLFVLIAGALAEELTFRGYPFQRLVEGLGPADAIVVLSLFFGFVHLRNPSVSFLAFVNTVTIGIVLALAYLRTRALWLPWGIHFGWNATLGVVCGLPVSGLTDFSVITQGTVHAPRWFAGGRYGLEGGALGTFVILLGFAYIIRFVPKVRPTASGPEGALGPNGEHEDGGGSIQETGEVSSPGSSGNPEISDL